MFQFGNGFKRLSWFLVFLLVFTSVPLTAGAADNGTSRPFYLDNKLLDQSTSEDPYPYNQQLITITGTYQQVDRNNLRVKVEQIAGGNVVDSYETGVTAVDDKKFEARDLTLYSGLNRITFIGYRGSASYSSEFYILYDSTPYLTELLVSGSSSEDNEPTPLNAGFGAVVRSQVIFLEGKAPNATRVIVNGYDAQVMSDGQFYSRALTLNPGKNDLTIEIINRTDRIQIQRTVYYYVEDQIVYDASLTIGSKSYPLSTDKDTAVSVGFNNNNISAKVSGKVLLPYTSGAGTPTVSFDVYDDDNKVSYGYIPAINLNNPQPVYVGTRLAYQYYSFEVSFDFQDLPDNKSIRNFALRFATSNDTDRFPVVLNNSNIPVVENVEWLVKYDESQPIGKRDLATKVPLDGATLNSSNVYILVTSNQNINNPQKNVIAYYEPYNGSQIPLKEIEKIGDTQRVYLMEQIPEGTHSVVFKIENTDDRFNKRVQFTNASGPYITLNNLYDGMIVDWKDLDEKLKNLEGQFHNVPSDFIPYDAGQNIQRFFITLNSVNLALDDGRFTWNSTTKEFGYDDFTDSVSSGENTLVLALDLNGDGNYEYEKTVRFYVMDQDLPVINAFKPVAKAKRHSSDDLEEAYDDKRKYENLFNDSIPNVNGVYYTQDSEFDLLMDLTNAKKGELLYDGKTVFSFDDYDDLEPKDETNEIDENEGISKKTIDSYYEDGRLLIRIRGIEFVNPGSLVFILKVENDKGGKAEQRLEIVNETVPYKILSPVANTGDDRIVVNKNFVTIKIEANGADYVEIGKTRVEKTTENLDDDDEEGTRDVFVYEYTGLKPNKENKIDFTIVRGNNKTEGSISVFYSNANVEGAAYKEPLSSKHKIFNGALELSFPRGTVLRSKEKNDDGVYTLFDNQKILFGIAHPEDGMVEKLYDDGTARETNSALKNLFSKYLPSNFTRISPIYWIHGGLATEPDEPRIHGLNPYDEEEYDFVYTRGKEDLALVPTQRGELTLKFDDSLRLAADHTVTVFYLNEDGEWENLGGVVNTKNNTITVPFDRFGYYTVMKLRYSFEDVREHPWGKDVLEAAYSKGLMNNLRYDEFGADDYATRGEFAQMLVKALALPLKYDDQNTFFDVPPDSRTSTWRYEYIETAARAGIVRGLETRIFGPNRTLTREQAASMVARALELKLPKNDAKLQENLKKMFTDYANIDYYAYPEVYAVYKEGIMTGRQNVTTNPGGNQKPTYRFDPQSYLTRAEAAAIVVRIMQKRKMLPDFLSGEQ